MAVAIKVVLLVALSWPLVQGQEAKDLNKIGGYNALEVIGKSPEELIEMRGFRTETHFAVTKDGYHIHLVRIINPKNDQETGVFKRPVIFNHGLFESGTLWLINANNVHPMTPSKQCGLVGDNSTATGELDTIYSNGPFLLANSGYDCWVMSMRGTDFSKKHDFLNSKDPRFWDYSLDDFALIDVPTVIDYVRRRTGALKVGYVGHSQATFAILGLLSVRTKYSRVVEPVIAVAPVSYFDNINSMGRILLVGLNRVMNPRKHGPFPSKPREMRKLIGMFCRSHPREMICQLLAMLLAGSGKKMHKGFFSHFPFHTSYKVLRHFGQLIDQKRNLMYDYGRDLNLRFYGQPTSPNYPLENINSDSLCLFSTETDALSHPKDVEKLKSRLRIKLYRDIKIVGKFNHFDLVINQQAAELVFKPMHEIFESFEMEAGGCSVDKNDSDDNGTTKKKELNDDHDLKETSKDESKQDGETPSSERDGKESVVDARADDKEHVDEMKDDIVGEDLL